MNANQRAWLLIEGNKLKYITKKHIMAITIDRSIARVRVAPMNMPSHVNAMMPLRGIATAQ